MAVGPLRKSGLIVLRAGAHGRPALNGRDVIGGWTRDVVDDSISLQVAILGDDIRLCVLGLNLFDPLRLGRAGNRAGHTDRDRGRDGDDDRGSGSAGREIELSLDNKVIFRRLHNNGPAAVVHVRIGDLAC
jgi:hypothetical protein